MTERIHSPFQPKQSPSYFDSSCLVDDETHSVSSAREAQLFLA